MTRERTHAMQPTRLSQRVRRSCTVALCAAGLGAPAAVAEAAPGRPTLAQIPIVSLPRQEALPTPDKVEESSENLPFEIIFPADRPKENKKKGVSSSYGEYTHWLSLRALKGDLCLRNGNAAASRPQDRDQVELYGYSGYSYADQVLSVRAERLELGPQPGGGQGPMLVAEDYFVSPRSGHARFASATRVPLVKVAEVSGGLKVYAFREPGRLTLVLSAPGAAMITPNFGALGLGCGISRVTIDTAGRSGAATSFAIGLPEMVAPEKVQDFRAYGQVPMERAIRVSVSVSQTSRDPAPVLSLTFGDPSRPVRDVLKDRMPRWNELLGQERAHEIEQKLAKRD